MRRIWIVSVGFAGSRRGIVDGEMVYLTWGKSTGELAQRCLWRKQAPRVERTSECLERDRSEWCEIAAAG